MEIRMVRIRAKPEHLDEFISETTESARASVLNEPGCRRLDIIQDTDDPTKLGLCEVYDDEEAVQVHLSQPHFTRWQQATRDWLAVEIGLSNCLPVFPEGDGHWDSARPAAVQSEAFQRGLFVIHAPLLVAADRVRDFIDALRLDALFSIGEEPGCLRFDIYQNKETPGELYLYEVYVNEEAFNYHMRTPHFVTWLETVKEWYAPGFSVEEGIRKGPNMWPPDNWEWRFVGAAG